MYISVSIGSRTELSPGDAAFGSTKYKIKQISYNYKIHKNIFRIGMRRKSSVSKICLYSHDILFIQSRCIFCAIIDNFEKCLNLHYSKVKIT